MVRHGRLTRVNCLVLKLLDCGLAGDLGSGVVDGISDSNRAESSEADRVRLVSVMVSSSVVG